MSRHIIVLLLSFCTINGYATIFNEYSTTFNINAALLINAASILSRNIAVTGNSSGDKEPQPSFVEEGSLEAVEATVANNTVQAERESTKNSSTIQQPPQLLAPEESLSGQSPPHLGEEFTFLKKKKVMTKKLLLQRAKSAATTNAKRHWKQRTVTTKEQVEHQFYKNWNMWAKQGICGQEVTIEENHDEDAVKTLYIDQYIRHYRNYRPRTVIKNAMTQKRLVELAIQAGISNAKRNWNENAQPKVRLLTRREVGYRFYKNWNDWFKQGICSEEVTLENHDEDAVKTLYIDEYIRSYNKYRPNSEKDKQTASSSSSNGKHSNQSHKFNHKRSRQEGAVSDNQPPSKIQRINETMSSSSNGSSIPESIIQDENDSAPAALEDVLTIAHTAGYNLALMKEELIFDQTMQAALGEICQKHNLPTDLLSAAFKKGYEDGLDKL